MVRHSFLAIALIFLLNGIGKSQERKDLGVLAGGSYYLGDYNQEIPLYQPSLGLGVIYRYNLNKYYSLRISALYEGVKGNYSASSLYLPGITGSFSKQIIEADGLCEINFMSFNTRHLKKDNFSPYVILGIGAAYIDGGVIPHIPFGVGVKYCPISRITLGIEWKLSKTFNDKIDSYQNVSDQSEAFLHNNDWFSFVGFIVTYRLFNYNNTCPVYQ